MVTTIILVVLLLGAIATAVAFGIKYAKRGERLKALDKFCAAQSRLIGAMAKVIDQEGKFEDVRKEISASDSYDELNELYGKILRVPKGTDT